MLKGFQLGVIVQQGSEKCLLRVPLDQPTQSSLAEAWETQYEVFINEAGEIDFNPGYKPDSHEHFCVSDYELPDWLKRQDSQVVSDIEDIGRDRSLINSIKGLVAFARDSHGEELMLFQNFTASQVIQPGRFLLLEYDTYKSVEQPGLVLDKKLSAVYLPAERKLLFDSFRNVNTFLPLDDYYKEASEEEIREVLSHNLFAHEDLETSVLHANATQWARTRVAMLQHSGVLEQYTAEEIRSRSAEFDVQVNIQNNKIVFPTNKSAARKLLQFLNEERFRGAITGTLYETNSKKKAE